MNRVHPAHSISLKILNKLLFLYFLVLILLSAVSVGILLQAVPDARAGVLDHLPIILLLFLVNALVLSGVFLLVGHRLLGRPLRKILQDLVGLFARHTGKSMGEILANTDEIERVAFAVRVLSEQLDRTMEEMQRGYSKLRLVAVISELSSNPGELTALLETILRELVRDTWLNTGRNAIRGGCISLFPQGRHRPMLRVHAGLPSEVVAQCGEAERGGCLCGRSIKRGEILFSPTLYQEEIQSQAWVGPSGYYSVPLVARDDKGLLGVMTCFVQGHIQSLEDDKNFLSSIAHAVSSLVEHKMADDAAEQHQRHLEKMVQERTKQLLHAERLATLGTFSAGIAHEINNPNAFIRGNLQYLQTFWEIAYPILKRHAEEDESGRVARFVDEVPDTLQDILSGSQRIETIVDSLKKYSRGGMTADRVLCRLVDPVSDALHLLDRLIKKSQVRIETAIPVELTMQCDRQQLCQVFVNLINNALDAFEGWSVEPKRIRISMERLDQHVWIRVMDNGPGVPEEAIGKLFDPFFTTKGKTKGTGLGLSIVQGIVEDHGGQITLYSAPGSETEVLIIFPVKG